MEDNNIKEEYGELKKRHKELPDFSELDNEFEVSCIDEPFMLKGIRKKITEKTEFYANMVKDLLQPESDLTNMYECRVFEESEKGEIYNTLKRLMFLLRLSAEIALKAEEKEDVKFIDWSFKEWVMIKPNLLRIVSKIKCSWEKETELKEDLGYFG
jgi:hypothetical protein